MKTIQPPRLLILAAGMVLLACLLLQSPAPGGDALAQTTGEAASGGPRMEASNYCLSCHAAGDPLLANPSGWGGGRQRLALSPCPAARRLQEELYYTERLLLAIERGRAGLGRGAELAGLDGRIAAIGEGYARLLDTPAASLDAFVSEAQSLRYTAGKVYSQINLLVEANKRQRALVSGILVTLVVLVSLGWGLYNTRRFSTGSPGAHRPSFYVVWAVLILSVFGLFLLPLFRRTSQQTASADTEIQTGLDASQRVALAAGRAQARAWMFSQVGAAWNSIDPEKAGQALAAALEAAGQADKTALALWGEAAAAQEIAVADAYLREKAGLVADQLDSTRGRAWPLALIGAEWSAVDPGRSAQIFEATYQSALSRRGIYRDLDLRRLAVSWAAEDPARALEVAGEISDPALRSWGLREIASLTSQAAVFGQAAEAARQAPDGYQRSRLLSQVAQMSGQNSLIEEAQASLSALEGPELAFALSELAVASRDVWMVEQIDPAYPGARSLAWLRLGEHARAWESTAQIQDPYERGSAQQAIVSLWAAVDAGKAAEAAASIQVPVLRERALRDVIRTTGDASLVENLGIAYYRVQALTSLGQFQAAWEQAGALEEPYPLAELGIRWAATDPGSAAQVLDLLTREADKAPVLRSLAALTGDDELFERALGMALAARVRNDALAPARASLDLGLSLLATDPEKAEAAFNQALEITQRISVK